MFNANLLWVMSEDDFPRSFCYILIIESKAEQHLKSLEAFTLKIIMEMETNCEHKVVNLRIYCHLPLFVFTNLST